MKLEDYQRNEVLIRQAISGFDQMTPEDREKARKAWVYKRSNILTQVFGVDSDSDTDGSNTNCGNGSEKQHG